MSKKKYAEEYAIRDTVLRFWTNESYKGFVYSGSQAAQQQQQQNTQVK